MTLLALTHVEKQRGERRRATKVLRDASLALEAGEIVLLSGPSGSGKTTLLSIAAGLLTADAGEVELVGLALRSASPAARRRHRARHVGFVFQRANLLDRLCARDNVLLAAALAGMARPLAVRETDRLLRALGIDALGGRSPASLSGGEEHRFAVARALVHRPQVVLADEPTGNLDRASGHAVAEALAALARDGGIAVLIASHDERLVEFATRRIALVDGRVQPREGGG